MAASGRKIPSVTLRKWLHNMCTNPSQLAINLPFFVEGVTWTNASFYGPTSDQKWMFGRESDEMLIE